MKEQPRPILERTIWTYKGHIITKENNTINNWEADYFVDGGDASLADLGKAIKEIDRIVKEKNEA